MQFDGLCVSKEQYKALGVGEPEVVVVDRVLLLLLLLLPAVNIMLCFVIVVVPKCAVQ